MTREAAHAELKGRIGQETHLSPWLEITQERVDAFASATGDHQWIHVDPARAATESPYGGTIAHGYLSLSLYPLLRGLVDPARPVYPGVKNVINYGINKLRFPNAVRVGARIRARTALVAVDEIEGGLQTTESYVVEVDGATKPACAAELIMRLYF